MDDANSKKFRKVVWIVSVLGALWPSWIAPELTWTPDQMQEAHPSAVAAREHTLWWFLASS